MYINTPKRYRGMQRRSMFSCGRILFNLFLVVLILIGIGVYQMREYFQPQMLEVVNTGLEQVNDWQATQLAPAPTPTENPQVTLVDAANNWSAGRVSFAVDAYISILSTVPNDVMVYSRVTEGYLTRGNTDDALTYAEDTVTANPFSADAWATRAFAYSWTGDFAQGIASAQQALALDPENARAQAYLGYAYYQGGQTELARSSAEDAIATAPDLWAGYWVRGLVNENVFPIDYDAAESDYETAYDLARDQNPAMAGVAGAGLGRVTAITDPQGAVTLLSEMLNFDDSNRELLFYLGVTHYRDLGQWGQARDPFTDCTEIAPEDVDCWYFLGRTLNSLDDQSGALEAFEQAIELDTQSARHYWWAARLARTSGSCAAAAPYLEIGYDMVIDGGLPSIEEGTAQAPALIEAYDDELAVCRITVVPNEPLPEATAEPEATEQAIGDA
ncbi:MAG: tetratricopeptide repeat protein [Chloroflexota bacterium]